MTKRSCKKIVRLKTSPQFRKALEALNRMNGRYKCRALNSASNQFIRDLSKTVNQVRYISPNQITPLMRKRIYKHRKAMRVLADRKSSVKRKKRLLTQKGGFYGKIIGALLGGILPNIFGGKQ